MRADQATVLLLTTHPFVNGRCIPSLVEGILKHGWRKVEEWIQDDPGLLLIPTITPRFLMFRGVSHLKEVNIDYFTG